MDQKSRDRFDAWMRAEEQGSLDDGDRAFAVVAKSWGRVKVPQGLASRAAAAATPAVLGSGVWMSWWLRAGVAASVAAAGTMLACLPSGALGAMLLRSVQMVVVGVDRSLWAVRAWAEIVGAIAGSVIHVATVLAGVMAAPAPMGVMAVNVALAGGALVALRRLLSSPIGRRGLAR